MDTQVRGDTPGSGAMSHELRRAVEAAERAIDRLVKLATNDQDEAAWDKSLVALKATGSLGLWRLLHLLYRTKDRERRFRAMISLGAMYKDQPIIVLPALQRVQETHDDEQHREVVAAVLRLRATKPAAASASNPFVKGEKPARLDASEPGVLPSAGASETGVPSTPQVANLDS